MASRHVMITRWRVPGAGAITAVCVLLGGTRHLSTRYYTSAAFEFPVAFSLFTSVWCTVATSVLAGWILPRRSRSTGLVVDVFRRRAPTGPLARSVGAVLLRTLLWCNVRLYYQCSLEGFHAFLPAALFVIETVFLRASHALNRYELLPLDGSASTGADDGLEIDDESAPKRGLTNQDIERPVAAGRFPVRYAILTLAFGIVGHQVLSIMQRPIGTICPSYMGIKWLVPAGQICMLFLDAALIVQAARWRRRADEANTSCHSSWASLGVVSLLSASTILVVALVVAVVRVAFPKVPQPLSWAPAVERLIVWDLVRDGAVAAATLLSAAALLATMSTCSVAATVAAVGILCQFSKQVGDERNLAMLSAPWESGDSGSAIGLAGIGAFVVLVFFLLRSPRGNPVKPDHSSPQWTARLSFAICYFVLSASLLFSLSTSLQHPISGPAGLRDLLVRGRAASKQWIRDAGQSKSLSEAVQQYRQRYGMPPPPHFDKWYVFATAHSSPVIDIFDQIHADLLPFWAVPPAVLRNLTTHLVEQTRAGIGGLSIRNHTVHLGHITPGSHFWMMEGYRGMIEPYLEWLPDLDMAFNIDDECRLVVPYDDMQALMAQGREAQTRLSTQHATSSFTIFLTPPWTSRHLEEGFKEAHDSDPLTPYISFRHPFHSVFDTYIAPTCPPSSPSLRQRWWSRRECLPQGRGLVDTNASAAVDLCQRPDIAQMHGYLLDPAIVGVSTTLLPIFSQSRVSGYADILVPSPWNFRNKVALDEAADMPWARKSSSVFWRGGSTDGASEDVGSWTAFLRSRFVELARVAAARRRSKAFPAAAAGGTDDTSPPPSSGSSFPAINASFIGPMRKHSPSANAAQASHFYGSSTAPPPSGVDFQSHWAHRHLIDLDGAAFSGRFLPFLQSRSLPYRAALFRTWYEERVHAWRHYVPLDIGLGNLWGLVAEMERSGGTVDDGHGAGQGGGGGGGIPMGEEIALEGRQWALRALRKEDMQVYMFRLLLEWARLVDDNRERLGFEVA